MIEYTLRMKVGFMNAVIGTRNAQTKPKGDLGVAIWYRSGTQSLQLTLRQTIWLPRRQYINSINKLVKAWTSYSTVDYNHNSTLSTSELKTLIWIYEENEPDYFRVT